MAGRGVILPFPSPTDAVQDVDIVRVQAGCPGFFTVAPDGCLKPGVFPLDKGKCLFDGRPADTVPSLCSQEVHHLDK